MNKFLIGAVAAASVSGLLAAPVSAQGATAPSYAHPSYASGEEMIRGRILSLSGAYGVQVRDDRGFVDSVRMHQGTIINPTGLQLASGMSVTIYGYNRGSEFAANEIDTPYRERYAVAYPYPVYPLYPYPGFYGPFGFYGRWR